MNEPEFASFSNSRNNPADFPLRNELNDISVKLLNVAKNENSVTNLLGRKREAPEECYKSLVAPTRQPTLPRIAKTKCNTYPALFDYLGLS